MGLLDSLQDPEYGAVRGLPRPGLRLVCVPRSHSWAHEGMQTEHKQGTSQLLQSRTASNSLLAEWWVFSSRTWVLSLWSRCTLNGKALSCASGQGVHGLAFSDADPSLTSAGHFAEGGVPLVTVSLSLLLFWGFV